MFLSEVYTQLCAGELSQLADGEGQTISDNAIPKINALILAGLNELNKHFSIVEKDIIVTTKLGKTSYELLPENAVSSSNPYSFIQDSVEDPFIGDIVQILSITDMEGRNLWGIEDTHNKVYSNDIYGTRLNTNLGTEIVLQAYNVIKLKEDHDYGDLLIRYKAKVKPFDTTLNPEDTFIDIPDHFMNALVLYVASRRYNPMGAETIGRSMFHEGNNYWSKYQEEIQTLKMNMANIGSTGVNSNFQKGGWV